MTLTLHLDTTLTAEDCFAYLEQRAEAYWQDSLRSGFPDARLYQHIAAALEKVAQELRETQHARKGDS